MFADPQSLTYNAVAESVKRINQDGYSTEYLNRDSSHETRLTISHSKEAKQSDGTQYERHLIRVDRVDFVAGVAQPAMSAYIVLRMKIGADPVVLSRVAQSLVDYSTDTIVDGVIAWQS